jgi:hypothetical protein
MLQYIVVLFLLTKASFCNSNWCKGVVIKIQGYSGEFSSVQVNKIQFWQLRYLHKRVSAVFIVIKRKNFKYGTHTLTDG